MMKILELLAIEICKPRSSQAVLGGSYTWYRPGNSPITALSTFHELNDQIIAENSEFYLRGDINCDVSSPCPNSNTIELLNILQDL